MIDETRRLVKAEAKLPALLQGGPAPDDPVELLACALVAYKQKLYQASVRFYADAFSKDPALAAEPASVNRYNGACAAALAGSGQGKDGGSGDETARARWRRQAREWLRAGLKLSEAELAGGTPESRGRVLRDLEVAQHDPDFAGVRGEEALSKLPAAEAAEWRALWKDVARLLELARAQ